jgi:hypothetical protein
MEKIQSLISTEEQNTALTVHPTYQAQISLQNKNDKGTSFQKKSY